MFRDAELKIRRAKKHIADLNALRTSFRAPEFYFLRPYIDPNTGQKFAEYGFAKAILYCTPLN